MNDTQILHSPRWQLCGEDWHLIIGNRSVARLIPNSDDPRHPNIHWLSLIDYEEFDDHGWHAVDFETLEIAQYVMEQWWWHQCLVRLAGYGDSFPLDQERRTPIARSISKGFKSPARCTRSSIRRARQL